MWKIIMVCLFMKPMSGMQDTSVMIERDFAALIPYISRVLRVADHDISPFYILDSFTQPDALIDKAIVTEHLKPSQYIKEILKKHRIRMGRDFEQKKSTCGHDSRQLLGWFIGYITEKIMPRALEDIKKEHEHCCLAKSYSSSGV